MTQTQSKPADPATADAKNWQVDRNCCHSGNCIVCMGRTPIGTPVRVVHMTQLTKADAKQIADRYRDLQASAKPMPPFNGLGSGLAVLLEQGRQQRGKRH